MTAAERRKPRGRNMHVYRRTFKFSIIVVFFLLFQHANAETLLDYQPTTSASSRFSSTPFLINIDPQQLGSTTIAFIRTKEANSAGYTGANIKICGYYENYGTSACSGNLTTAPVFEPLAVGLFGTPPGITVDYNLDTPFDLTTLPATVSGNPLSRILLEFAPQGSYMAMYGDAQVPPCSTTEAGTGNTPCWGGLGAPFLQIADEGGFIDPGETASSSRITTNLSVVASTTSPGNVDFSYGYFNGEPIDDPVAFACTRFADITALISLSPLCSVVSLTGAGTYNRSNNLAIGHTFFVDPYITNASSTIIDTGRRERFVMGTSTIGAFDLAVFGATSSDALLASSTMECDPSDEFFSRSICNVAVLLFVPPASSFVYYGQTLNVMSEKFPFSYFFAIIGVVQDLQDLGNTASPTAFALDLSGNPMIATTIDILSVATVDSYLGTTARELLRTLMGYSLWIAFAMMVFHRVRMIFV